MLQTIDEDLLAADQEARSSGSITPLLKKELWLKIQSRRLSEGKEELVVPPTPSPSYQISQAEKAKKLKRQEQNRRAAKRFRVKEKRKHTDIIERIEDLEDDHRQLEEERVSLIQQKNRMLLQLCHHFRHCQIGPSPPLTDTSTTNVTTDTTTTKGTATMSADSDFISPGDSDNTTDISQGDSSQKTRTGLSREPYRLSVLSMDSHGQHDEPSSSAKSSLRDTGHEGALRCRPTRRFRRLQKRDERGKCVLAGEAKTTERAGGKSRETKPASRKRRATFHEFVKMPDASKKTASANTPKADNSMQTNEHETSNVGVFSTDTATGECSQLVPKMPLLDIPQGFRQGVMFLQIVDGQVLLQPCGKEASVSSADISEESRGVGSLPREMTDTETVPGKASGLLYRLSASSGLPLFKMISCLPHPIDGPFDNTSGEKMAQGLHLEKTFSLGEMTGNAQPRAMVTDSIDDVKEATGTESDKVLHRSSGSTENAEGEKRPLNNKSQTKKPESLRCQLSDRQALPLKDLETRRPHTSAFCIHEDDEGVHKSGDEQRDQIKNSLGNTTECSYKHTKGLSLRDTTNTKLNQTEKMAFSQGKVASGQGKAELWCLPQIEENPSAQEEAETTPVTCSDDLHLQSRGSMESDEVVEHHRFSPSFDASVNYVMESQDDLTSTDKRLTQADRTASHLTAESRSSGTHYSSEDKEFMKKCFEDLNSTPQDEAENRPPAPAARSEGLVLLTSRELRFLMSRGCPGTEDPPQGGGLSLGIPSLDSVRLKQLLAQLNEGSLGDRQPADTSPQAPQQVYALGSLPELKSLFLHSVKPLSSVNVGDCDTLPSQQRVYLLPVVIPDSSTTQSPTQATETGPVACSEDDDGLSGVLNSRRQDVDLRASARNASASFLPVGEPPGTRCRPMETECLPVVPVAGLLSEGLSGISVSQLLSGGLPSILYSGMLPEGLLGSAGAGLPGISNVGLLSGGPGSGGLNRTEYSDLVDTLLQNLSASNVRG